MGSMQPLLRIAILECDTPLPETKAKFGSYGGVFQFLLRSGARALGKPDFDHGFEFSNHQIESDPENYPDLADVDAILITGSSEWRCWDEVIQADGNSRIRFVCGYTVDHQAGGVYEEGTRLRPSESNWSVLWPSNCGKSDGRQGRKERWRLGSSCHRRPADGKGQGDFWC